MLNRRFKFMLREADSGAGTGPAAEPADDQNPVLPGTALTGDDPPAADPPAGDPAAEGEGGEPQEGEPKDEAADLKPETPEGYKLSFAEGTEVDAELLGQFQKMAHEMGLSLGQTQKMADFYAGHMAGLGQKYQEAQVQALNDYITARNAEIQARPNYKEEIVLAKKTLKEFGSDELAQIFQQTGMGSHPGMFDFVVKVGRALSEPGIKGGPAKPPDQPLHERIWGKDGLGGQPTT